MLSETQLNKLPNDIVKIAQQFEDEQLSEAISIVNKYIKDMEEKGTFDKSAFYEEIARFNIKYKKSNRKVVKDLVKAGVATLIAAKTLSDKEDEKKYKENNKKLNTTGTNKILNRQAKDYSKYIKETFKTTGFQDVKGAAEPRKVLLRVVDRYSNSVINGDITYQEATKRITKEIAGNGIKCIEYKSGVFRNVDVVARQSVLSYAKQLSEQCAIKNGLNSGVTIFEFTAHANARPTHQVWQGKRFDLQGIEYPTLKQLTNGEENDYGCQHTYFPVLNKSDRYMYTSKELANINTSSFMYNGKAYNGYEAKETQRRYEREIRALKRQKNSLENTEIETKDISYKIRKKTKEYNSFSEAAGISPKPNRLTVY